MGHDGRERLPSAGIPNPGRAIAARGRESFAAGIKHGLVGAGGELDGDGRAAGCGDIPEPGGRVGADGQHPRPVRGESDQQQRTAMVERGESGSPVAASQTRAAPS